MNNMRRKSSGSGSGGGYNNQHRKQRYSGGGGSGGGENRSHNSGGGNRPRRNYGAAREKYLNQAREALAAGDRVLAENYFQHAEHCFRMMVEEGSHRPNYTPPPQQADGQNGEQGGEQTTEQGNEQPQDMIPEVTTALPAFLTANFEGAEQAKPVDPAAVQNWEERDA